MIDKREEDDIHEADESIGMEDPLASMKFRDIKRDMNINVAVKLFEVVVIYQGKIQLHKKKIQETTGVFSKGSSSY